MEGLSEAHVREEVSKSPAITAFQGRHLEVIQHDGAEYVRSRAARGVVLVIPVTSTSEIVLIEQFRRALNCNVIEFPAGLVGDEDPDETFEAAARRELVEESGYAANELKFWLRGPSSPGGSAEIVDFFFAPNVVKQAGGGGVDHERILVHCIPLATVEPWLEQKRKAGVLVDPRVLLGVYLAKNLVLGTGCSR